MMDSIDKLTPLPLLRDQITGAVTMSNNETQSYKEFALEMFDEHVDDIIAKIKDQYINYLIENQISINQMKHVITRQLTTSFNKRK